MLLEVLGAGGTKMKAGSIGASSEILITWLERQMGTRGPRGSAICCRSGVITALEEFEEGPLQLTCPGNVPESDTWAEVYRTGKGHGARERNK